MSELTFSDDMATCEPFIRSIWCESNANSLGLSNEGPMHDLMTMQFDAKIGQYRKQFPDLKSRVFYKEGQACGYLMSAFNDNDVVIVDLAVAPDFQGQGIGTALLQSCIDNADLSNRALKLTVVRSNPVISLYQGLGFVIEDADDVHYQMRRREKQAPY